MLRKNPKGGRPLQRLGAIDWDETVRGFQHKLGYCKCGAKVLATTGELEEIVEHFGYLKAKRRFFQKVALSLLKKLV